jgi:hypothetical protein
VCSSDLFNNPERFATAFAKVSNSRGSTQAIAENSRSPYTKAMENLSAAMTALKNVIWGVSVEGKKGIQDILAPAINGLSSVIENVLVPKVDSLITSLDNLIQSLEGGSKKNTNPGGGGGALGAFVTKLAGSFLVFQTLFGGGPFNMFISSLSYLNNIVGKLTTAFFTSNGMLAKLIRSSTNYLGIYDQVGDNLSRVVGHTAKLKVDILKLEESLNGISKKLAGVGAWLKTNLLPLVGVFLIFALIIQDLYVFLTGSGESVIGDFFAAGDEKVMVLVVAIIELLEILDGLAAQIGDLLGTEFEGFLDMVGKISSFVAEWLFKGLLAVTMLVIALGVA